MSSQLRNLAEYYLEVNNTPDVYISLYQETKDTFAKLFDQYYKKFVLDKPTLEERWNAYANTPMDWLEHSRWLEHFNAIVEVDSVQRQCDLTGNWVVDYDRGHEFDRDDIVQHIDELIESLEAGETEAYELGYMFQQKRNKIPLAIDIIDQWKEQLILRKVGSFRNDW